MATAFIFSDRNFRSGPDSDLENPYLTDSELIYPRITEPGAPASRGIRWRESNSWDRVIYFFTRDGVYLGHILIPKNQ